MLVPILMIHFHVSEKSKKGPKAAHIIMSETATTKPALLPVALVTWADKFSRKLGVTALLFLISIFLKVIFIFSKIIKRQMNKKASLLFDGWLQIHSF